MGPLADCAAGGDATPGSPREWNGGELYRVRNGIVPQKSGKKGEHNLSFLLSSTGDILFVNGF